uniref:Vav guanine nucleotide exchange factor 3 n=1 Tax=Nothobranchius furzeri TaxID=105023 RepID=A0A8C6PWS3_NOTFU
MEHWRQCALWLINCKVLPPSHRVTWESAQVFDLAQTLRDGVLLCHLLNNLKPQCINLKEINLRPQMSQFLCLKNIRTFLGTCSDTFGIKKSDLFDAFDLFDVRNFGKVMETLSILSHTMIAQQTGIRPFPTEESVEDEDIYNHLEDLIDENRLEDEEDLYDCVYDDEEGGEIYEDLMKTEAIPPPKQAEIDIRSCCLMELKQTEEKYTETLESIEKVTNTNPTHTSGLLIYGKYCSLVETAIVTLDSICKNREDVRMKLEECSKRANYGKFTLRDLLVVPMQRVLKYHLLLQELVKHTHDAAEKSNLRTALDAMKDLAQYVNEVKRDNETLREIDQYQKSIENLNQTLRNYGRPKGDGEVRVSSVDKRAKQDRHIFLFDSAVIVCKRRGDNYEMKEVIDLHNFKITNNPTADKENRKWSYGFYLTHNQGQNGFEFFFKTKELKKKWLDVSNCNNFSCVWPQGIFNQGYLCSKCGLGAHKECLGRFGVCGKTGESGSQPYISCAVLYQQSRTCLPKMLVIRNYFGVPSPASGQALSIQTGDIIELIRADLHSPWWQGRIPSTREAGFFPSDAVRPCPCIYLHLCCFRFAGPMERFQAEAELVNRVNSTYLVRHRSKEFTEYAISIKYNNDVKHIKILTRDGSYYIAENRKFRGIFVIFFIFPLALTPKVIGMAIARYDFSSRDTRELSLQEGEVVKIYTKTGSNGWWRGEVNSRVGWFPSTYVEEVEE